MLIPVLSTILILLTSCGSVPEYREIMVNKTVKVYSQDYHDEQENYTFKWDPPLGPNKKDIGFDLKNDMLIFTPVTEGDYEIHLSITDISDEVVAEEVFYYRAVPETLEVAIAEPNPEDEHIPAVPVVKKPEQTDPPKPQKRTIAKKTRKKKKANHFVQKKEPVDYAIQIASWPSLAEARKDQIRLVEEGFDAYIQRYYREEKDAVWYRVRIGNFQDKNKALEVQGQIESIMGVKSWLDVISK